MQNIPLIAAHILSHIQNVCQSHSSRVRGGKNVRYSHRARDPEGVEPLAEHVVREEHGDRDCTRGEAVSNERQSV